MISHDLGHESSGEPAADPTRSSTSRPGRVRRWAIAHRGHPLHAIENTLSAVTSAVRAGADVVEVDVRVTRDGVAVLHHDRTLARLWSRPEAVPDLDLDELRAAVPAIPTLAQAHTLMQGTGIPLVLDLGSVAAAQAAVQAVEEAGGHWDADPVTATTWFCGHPGALAWLRAEGIAAPRLLTWKHWTAVPEAIVAAVAPTFFNPWHRLVTPGLVRRWHDRGVRVSTWTVDSPARRRRLLSWGVDAVTSNAVDALVADLRPTRMRAAS